MNTVANRYERFAREHVVDLNATRAAKAAGYSENGANSKGAQLLANVSIRKRVDKLLSQRASKLESAGANTGANTAKNSAKLSRSKAQSFAENSGKTAKGRPWPKGVSGNPGGRPNKI